jgi:hypothetical protein
VPSGVAAVGQGGLQISEPGTWSDLALARLIQVGMVPQARGALAAQAG